MQLKGQLALVTGASRGIGRAVAMELSKTGAHVLGTATSVTGVDAIEHEFASNGLSGKAYILDVADADSVTRLGAELKADGYSPTILVNNAGITRDQLLLRMKADEWDAVINTNLSSIYRLSKLCLRSMIKSRYGRIINMGSVVALSGNVGQTSYAAAKAGILGFTRSLAREVGSRGITVNTVAPGLIDTDMTSSLSDIQQTSLLSQIPLKRFGNVREVAGVVVFLASAQAAYITGETINVSGGMYIG